MSRLPSYGESAGPLIITLKYRGLSSYGVALTPATNHLKNVVALRIFFEKFKLF
jgi:hypothetical protein